jgi:hypothetical protein
LIDRYLLPQIAYQGAVICFDGQRYRVENIDPKKKNILLASENRPSHTEVLLTADLKLKAGVNANSHAIAMGIAPRKSASLARGGVEVSIRHAGSRSYEGFGFEAPHFQGPSEDRKSSELEAAEISTYAVTIAFDDLKLKPAVLHSIGHLFKVVLPFFITNAAREVRVVELQSCEWMGGKPAIVVYENIPGGNGIAELIENDLARIFNRAYEILVRCPCTDGCQGCLKIPDCSHVDANDELDKIGTIEFLGDLLSKNSAETVKNRTEAIDSASEAEYYRWEIVDLILPYRLGLRIGEAADFLVENDPAAKGWPEYIAGYYIPAQNRVEVRPQREQDMIACLAHEYGHNWQFQGAPKGMDQKLMGAENVPYFSGRLVIEGFAQWIEFKAADHYGFRQAAKDIVFRHCDEYKEGFELLKWLEENSGGGVNRVIEFMINGEVKLGKKVVKLDDLIFAAKMKQRFLEAEARLKTRPQEDIQTKENAPKPPVPPEPVSPPAAPPPPETGVELPPTQGEKPAGEPPQAEAGANLPPAGETPVSEPPQAEAVAEEPQTPISEPPLPEVAPEEPQAPVSEPPHVEGPAEPSGVAETESAILGEPPTAPAPETPEQPGGTTEEHSAIN